MHEQVQEALREMIISGHLLPGALLTPSSLASVMNTSATPIREAIRVLEQEGLVEIADRRFTRVAIPRRSVADEAYPLISLLEGNCIRARGEVREDLLKQAEEANNAQAHATTVSERLHAAIRFHRLLCANAGPIMSGFLETLYGKVALLEISYHTNLWHDMVSTREHTQMVDLIRQSRFDDAANVLNDHWVRGHRDVVALLEDDDATNIEDTSVRTLPAAASRRRRRSGDATRAAGAR
jgi:DNA-binding GntR family transcriptional regulator